MAIEVRPATVFEDVRTLVGTKRPDASAKVDLTMAYAGIRKNFEAAGFTWASDTTSVLAGHPRVLMRRDLS